MAYGFTGSRAVVRISQQLFRRGTIVEPPPVTDITPPVTGATPPVTDDALVFFPPSIYGRD